MISGSTKPQSPYRVSNVNEAVELAKKLKQEGTYDWFRGQIQNWKLSSSFSRLNEADRNKAHERIIRFVKWIEITPGLESLVEQADAAIAVAQHYGLRTNFVDFTTKPEIAGFFASFASHGTPPVQGEESCIICLNTQDLTEFWEGFPPEYIRTETLNIDVSNLWRLQAQHGVFLFFPYDSRFEKFIYHFDRIIFPFTGLISSPLESEIFPERKSQLEILLEQFFMNEVLIEGNQFIKRDVWDFVWQLPQIPYIPKMLINGELPPSHNSWQKLKIESWLRQDDERYHAALSETSLRLEVDSSEDIITIINKTASLIGDVLNQTRDIRQRLVVWSLIDRSGIVFEKKFTECIEQLWDGLRTLPYSDDEIALGIGRCIGLIICSTAQNLSWEEASAVCFGGEVLEVEFGSEDGSYSRAFVNRCDLMGAVRRDIRDFLAPDYVNHLCGNVHGLLQAIRAPQHLFDFQRLASLFVCQIAPSQVLTCSAKAKSAIFYSPARLATFGLP